MKAKTYHLIASGLAGASATLVLAGALVEVWRGAAATAAVLTAIAAIRYALVREHPLPSANPPPAPPSNQPPPRTEFEDALEAMSDPTLIVGAMEPDDLAGRRILFANPAAQSLMRIPREGALLLSAIRRPEVLEAIDTALFGDLGGTVAYDTGGAQNRFWRVVAAPLPPRGQTSERRLCLVVMQDETEVRRSERMRADFMANASHELRTPLASLTGFIETLRGHAREDEGARERFLSIMAVQADRMARLIDDLMSLTRIESHEHIRPENTCDLIAATRDITEALSTIAAQKGVTLRLDVPDQARAQIIGDRDQLMQVIQNLIDNALKYSPRGGEVLIRIGCDLRLDAASASGPASPRLAREDGGRLSLLTPDRSEDDTYHRLEVIDQGPGMDRRHLPRLAERFYRVEGQKSGERLGTGLGLAIVKHIVNRHRGGLWVESAPGFGAVFAVYFPVASTDPRPKGAKGGKISAPTDPVTKS